MIVTVAVGAAAALALLSLRSLAFAFAHSVSGGTGRGGSSARARRLPADEALSRRQITMMVMEVAMSAGIILLSVGLAAAAALPAFLLVGALLAQVAVLGALFAPPVFLRVGAVSVRPAALALGIAQLAHVAFFLRAIEALL